MPGAALDRESPVPLMTLGKGFVFNGCRTVLQAATESKRLAIAERLTEQLDAVATTARAEALGDRIAEGQHHAGIAARARDESIAGASRAACGAATRSSGMASGPRTRSPCGASLGAGAAAGSATLTYTAAARARHALRRSACARLAC